MGAPSSVVTLSRPSFLDFAASLTDDERACLTRVSSDLLANGHVGAMTEIEIAEAGIRDIFVAKRNGRNFRIERESSPHGTARIGRKNQTVEKSRFAIVLVIDDGVACLGNGDHGPQRYHSADSPLVPPHDAAARRAVCLADWDLGLDHHVGAGIAETPWLDAITGQ